jgi:hypothetical protein
VETQDARKIEQYDCLCYTFTNNKKSKALSGGEALSKNI